MATPAFGFSVGDFISAINLVNKVRKSLKDAGGAASEYRSAVIELENLAVTLSHLEAFQPNEDNIQHVNAIRAMAMACRIPLEEFTKKMTRYESSLGPLARPKSLHTIGQKVKWSVTFAEDVEKLRALVAAKHVSINLLGMQTSKMLSKMSAEMRSSVKGLEEKIAENHATIYSVQERTQSMDDRTKVAQVADHEILKSVCAGVDRMDHSVVRLRDLGQQIMDYLNAFSGKTQGLLRAILQSNFQTYQLMLQMQQNISPRPTNLLESNIRFEDALGEIKELPYEYFRHWEPFEGFLRAHFRHKPGESKIVNSQYHIIDNANKAAIIKKDHWTRYVREGATISMSMIMSHIKMQPGVCPRPDCLGAGSHAEGTSNTLYCKICCLQYFQLENILEDRSRRITVLPEDEEVAKKQIADDVSLYGGRPDPPDAVEVNEHNELSNLPPKRSAEEFDAAVSRPAKVRGNKESKEFNLQRVTAMDWNSGATPLDAWLNQSALPSIVPLPQTQRNQSGSPSDDLAPKELEELKVFRIIHIEEIEEPDSIEFSRSSVIDLTILEPKAQIYLRNILDRYPLLPSYLALRLAKANCARANRLALTRQNGRDQLTSKPVQIGGHDRTPPRKRRSLIDDVAQFSKTLGIAQDGINHDSPPPKTDEPRPHTRAICTRLFARSEHLKEQERSHANVKEFTCEQCSRCFTRRDLLLRHQRRVHMSPLSSNDSKSEYPSSHANAGFWTVRDSTSRAVSVHSQSSERNSSLHGSGRLDLEDRDLSFPDDRSRHSSAKFSESSVVFPPPPVYIEKQRYPPVDAGKGTMDQAPELLCFFCDICEQKIEVLRRRDWQIHVLQDLRPYVCTVEDCDEPTTQFNSRRSHLLHEFRCHELEIGEHDSDLLERKLRASATSACGFCGEQTGGKNNSREKHIGRHMEEIAFAVVRKPYEAWDFYSDSSGPAHHDIESDSQASKPYGERDPYSGSALDWPPLVQTEAKHVVENAKMKILCDFLAELNTRERLQN